ncbi:hypothetical protein BDY24DRAFT_395136 [Mrakia frigida]|uniref:uncharacterized protein n=1 Tax=Mrakia frigida TaxID=29902 RepID=UPI003FCC17ED
MASSLNSKQERLERYSTFVETILEPSLASLHMTQAILSKELTEYQGLLARLLEIQEHGNKPVEMLMDLGAEVFATALIPDTSFVNVDLGLQGVHAQLTVPEAIDFSRKREALLKKRIELMGERITNVEDQIVTVDLAVQEILLSEGTKAILKT